MIGFWIAAALLAAGAGALMLHRAARGGGMAVAADPSLAVYRRALVDIDGLAERDLLAADEHRAVRAEAARRLLTAADRPVEPVKSSGRPTIPLFAAGGVAVAAAAIYLAISAPGVPDQPFAVRLADWRAHPERYPPTALAAALGAIANERPGDLEPLRRLASLDLSLGDADGAVHALRRAMAIAPGRADLPAMLGEVLVIRAQGKVDPSARALFQRALAADPTEAAARYYVARAKIADGNVAGGVEDWRALLAALPVADSRRAQLADQIDRVTKTGKLPNMAGESAPPPQDVSNAIHGMVDGLAIRLESQPDDPPGWVRLVRAYAVLGETQKRDEALVQARARFAKRPDVLTALDGAAHAAPRAVD